MESVVESTPGKQKLPQGIVSGMAWTLGTQIANQGSRFLVSVILARLLGPRDFGLIGMVFVFTGFATAISDFGFSQALVQRENVEERHRSTVFWLTCLTGLLLALLTVGGAPLVAKFYRESRLAPLMTLIALAFPVSSLNVVQKAMMYRAMRFRALGLIETGGTVVSGIVGVTLAIRGFGAKSLVWQFLASYFFVVTAMWWVGKWRPRFEIDRGALKELFGYSSHLTAFSAVNYWFRNGDNLLVGKFFGAWDLGIYARAYTLMLLPLNQVTSVVSKVMFPVFSRLQNEPQRVKDLYLRMIGIIALITFPMMLGLFATTDHFVIAAFGPAWAAMIPVLRIFSILGMLQSIISTTGLIFQSQGRTDWQFWWGIFSAGACIAAIVLGVWMGSLVAIATSLLLISIVLFPLYFSIPGKLIGLTVPDVLRKLWSVLGCAVAMACAVWAMQALLPRGWRHWEYLAVEVLFGMAGYACLVLVFGLAPYRELRAMAARKLPGKPQPPVALCESEIPNV